MMYGRETRDGYEFNTPPPELSAAENSLHAALQIEAQEFIKSSVPAELGEHPSEEVAAIDVNAADTSRDELRAVVATERHHVEYIRAESGTLNLQRLERRISDLNWLAEQRRSSRRIANHKAHLKRVEVARDRLLREASQAQRDELANIAATRTQISRRDGANWLSHLRTHVGAAQRQIESLTRNGEPQRNSPSAETLENMRGVVADSGSQLRKLEAELARLDARETELIAEMMAS